MIPNYEKIQWLLLLLIEERPRTSGDIARSTGINRGLVDDALYDLIRRGEIADANDSRLYRLYPDFRARVARFIEADPDNARRLAAQFDSLATWPARLAYGAARPHPLMQAQVVRYIEDYP